VPEAAGQLAADRELLVGLGGEIVDVDGGPVQDGRCAEPRVSRIRKSEGRDV
jgi:hypothetical protein